MYSLKIRGRYIEAQYNGKIIVSGHIGQSIQPDEVITAIKREEIPSGFKGELLENAVRGLDLIKHEGDRAERTASGNMWSVGADLIESINSV